MTNKEASKILDLMINLDHNEPVPNRDLVIEAIQMAIKALKENEWIPRKERLPKKDGTYLISGKWADGKEAVGECGYSRHDGYFRTAWNFDVLAWKPLPEPYREEL